MIKDKARKFLHTPGSEIDKRRKEEIARNDDMCLCAGGCGKEIDKKTSVQDSDGFLCSECLDLREEEDSGPRV